MLCSGFSISAPFFLSFLIFCYLSYFQDSLVLVQQSCFVNSCITECPLSFLIFFLIHCLWSSSGNRLIISLFLESLTALSRLSYYIIQGTAVSHCPKLLPHLRFRKEFIINEGWNLHFRFCSLFLQVMGESIADSVEFSLNFHPDIK